MPTLILALLTGIPDAHAVRQAVPRPALCARAAAVVIAEVTGTEARWEPDGTIATYADVAVTRVVRGAAPDALTVAYPGGTVGGVTLDISEAPRLRPDARYLLLLAPGASAWTLVGGPDGAVPLRWGAQGPGETEADAVASLGGCRA